MSEAPILLPAYSPDAWSRPAESGGPSSGGRQDTLLGLWRIGAVRERRGRVSSAPCRDARSLGSGRQCTAHRPTISAGRWRAASLRCIGRRMVTATAFRARSMDDIRAGRSWCQCLRALVDRGGAACLRSKMSWGNPITACAAGSARRPLRLSGLRSATPTRSELLWRAASRLQTPRHHLNVGRPDDHARAAVRLPSRESDECPWSHRSNPLEWKAISCFAPLCESSTGEGRRPQSHRILRRVLIEDIALSRLWLTPVARKGLDWGSPAAICPGFVRP